MLSILTNIDDKEYNSILTVLSSDTSSEYYLNGNDSKVLVDGLLQTGSSPYRFFKVVDGKAEYVKPSKLLEEEANKILRKYPSYVKNSLLTKSQIKKLLK